MNKKNKFWLRVVCLIFAGVFILSLVMSLALQLIGAL